MRHDHITKAPGSNAHPQLLELAEDDGASRFRNPDHLHAIEEPNMAIRLALSIHRRREALAGPLCHNAFQRGAIAGRVEDDDIHRPPHA